jgi:hypothetical protein
LKPIHDWHLYIHQYDVKLWGSSCNGVNAQLTVGRQGGEIASGKNHAKAEQQEWSRFRERCCQANSSDGNSERAPGKTGGQFNAKQQNQALPTLVLWGKIALWLEALEGVDAFPKLVSEHPYNLSFIQNTGMQQFFAPLRLLYC